MITKKTAQEIWASLEAIERCNILIEDMNKEIKKTGDERLIDAFGRKRGLELGIPCGDTGHRIYNVRIDLAIEIIKANIEDHQIKLIKLNALAKIELK